MTYPRYQITLRRLLGSVALLCVALGLLMEFSGPAGNKGLVIPVCVMFVAAAGQLFGRPVIAVVMASIMCFVMFAVFLPVLIVLVALGFD
ncbi:MAG: hypothetical protein ACREHD_07590 [Pirellulales bacterium]